MSIKKDIDDYAVLLGHLEKVKPFTGAINDPARAGTLLVKAGSELIQEGGSLEEYVTQYEHAWQLFAGHVTGAMENWVPKKWGHSIAVGMGVDALAHKIAHDYRDPADKTESGLKEIAANSAIAHDCGTVVNVLGVDLPMAPRYTLISNPGKSDKYKALDGVTPADFCAKAAAGLLNSDAISQDDRTALSDLAQKLGKTPQHLLAQMIAADAISDRGGALYKLAKGVDPAIHATLRAFYKEPDVHRANIPAPNMLDEHHNAPKVYDPANKAGKDRFWDKDHTLYDHAGITIDSIFGGLPDAGSLDELAVYAIAAAETGKIDKAYLRQLMEAYGTNQSLFETLYQDIKTAGVKEIPPAVRMSAPAAEFAEDLKSVEAIEKKYPQLGWSPLASKDAAGEKLRQDISDGIQKAGSVFGFVVQRVATYPELSAQRLSHDIGNVNLGAVITPPPSTTQYARAIGGPELGL
ncbi:MAG: hypothetical protein LRZ85_01095 [Alphaproteobacteria bacterium]|nr:hypothetical protein [Alphaproteobacteria bacterium]MCD8570616.1 hypothetical protein [Alphaproteobacteria bacterium]